MRHLWVMITSTQSKDIRLVCVVLLLFAASLVVWYTSSRCFAHIVNISIQHVLSYITHFFEHQKAENPLAKVRHQITHLQSSNLHHTAFQILIKQGNTSGDFEPKVPELELLRDMPVQWDSTFLMIEWFLLLQLVSCYQKDFSSTLPMPFFRP